MKTVKKIWGEEKWIENNKLYCFKILTLKKNYQCSFHYHKIKDETFLILSGAVGMTVDIRDTVMRPGDAIRIKPKTTHRFAGLQRDTKIIEVSTHHEDCDSYRSTESRLMNKQEKKKWQAIISAQNRK